jgi:hypothetical protein
LAGDLIHKYDSYRETKRIAASLDSEFSKLGAGLKLAALCYAFVDVVDTSRRHSLVRGQGTCPESPNNTGQLARRRYNTAF